LIFYFLMRRDGLGYCVTSNKRSITKKISYLIIVSLDG